MSVIPAMDKITMSKTLYHPSLLAAIALARKKMDQYYSLTDLSPIYHIAMGLSTSAASFLPHLTQSFTVLHPGLKLEYFKQHEWEKEWIEQAERLIHQKFLAKYTNKGNKGEVSSETSSSATVCILLNDLSSS